MELFQTLLALGERKAGSEIGARARGAIRAYLGARFPGAAVREEPFQILASKSDTARIVLGGGQALPVHLYENTGLEGSAAEGELLWVGSGLNPLGRRRYADRIVVFGQSQFHHRLLQVDSAYRRKARGVILVTRFGEHVSKGIGYPYQLGHCEIPVVGMSRATWKRLEASAPGRLRIEYQNRAEPRQGGNILIDLFPDRLAKGTIVLGAHFDSWYSGAQDNTVAVQLLADLLAELGDVPGGYGVRGVFFDAEELGVLGAYHHADHCADLDAYRLFVNLEMPVPTLSGKLKLFFYSPHRALRRSFSGWRFFGRGVLPVPFRLFYRLAPFFPSDSDPFYRKGIPCVSTFCSNPNLHTPLDSPENIRWADYPLVKAYLLAMIRSFCNQALAASRVDVPKKAPL